MAKIRVTRVNFTSVLMKDTKGDFTADMLKMFTGKNLNDMLKDVPEEESFWIDTDYVCAVSSRIKISEIGQVVFSIQFIPPYEGNSGNIWIKGEQYEDFIKIWVGQQEWLDEGVYKVGLDVPSQPGAITVKPEMWAEVSEDGQTVTVRRKMCV